MRRFLTFLENANLVVAIVWAWCLPIGMTVAIVLLACACTHPPAATPAMTIPETRCN